MLTDHTNVMVKKKDCQIRHLPLDKSHFITEIGSQLSGNQTPTDKAPEEDDDYGEDTFTIID